MLVLVKVMVKACQNMLIISYYGKVYSGLLVQVLTTKEIYIVLERIKAVHDRKMYWTIATMCITIILCRVITKRNTDGYCPQNDKTNHCNDSAEHLLKCAPRIIKLWGIIFELLELKEKIIPSFLKKINRCEFLNAVVSIVIKRFNGNAQI